MSTYVSHTCTPYLPIGPNRISPLKLYCRNTGVSLRLGAVHILRNTIWGGGLPDLLQYYIGGGLPNLLQYYIGRGLERLLQYYSFERKMEGYNPFSALD